MIYYPGQEKKVFFYLLNYPPKQKSNVKCQKIKNPPKNSQKIVPAFSEVSQREERYIFLPSGGGISIFRKVYFRSYIFRSVLSSGYRYKFTLRHCLKIFLPLISFNPNFQLPTGNNVCGFLQFIFNFKIS